jgi:homoserine O-succinyltransferase
MALFLDSGRSQSAVESNAANCVTIGLVNNMPDAAVEATERQFTDLIRAASPNAVVLLKLFAIPQVPREAGMRRALTQRYRDIAALWDTPLDGLIVTGTEPRALDLTDEPYWGPLSALVDWARQHTASTIFGVFDCRLAADHPMTQHFPKPLWVPHSRYNDLSEQALTSCGYKILTRSATAGVDSFAKQDGSFFLFFQGHPEYDADTLLREYRRDAARWLAGERADYPATPLGYFDGAATAIAESFRARALADRRSDLIADFPKAGLEAGLQSPWRSAALGIYRKWTGYLTARKGQCRAVKGRLRRTWRDWPTALRRAADSSAR